MREDLRSNQCKALSSNSVDDASSGIMTVDDESRAASDIEFRPYASGDVARCVDLSVAAWPAANSGLPHDIKVDYWRLLVDLACKYSDIHEVACYDGKVVGVIFTRTAGPPTVAEKVSLLRVYFSGLLGITRKMGVVKAFPLEFSSAMTELKIILKGPESNGEVALLVVDAEFRGVGIGRQLLERHLELARGRGVGVISVYTTDPGCNWGFYEAFGFKKAVEFDDEIGSYLEGSQSKGLIFTLTLRQ